MAKRPPISSDLERQVLLESGHRCAIHACRQVPVEIAHIVPWSRCRSHAFANLIALCPTCHTRYDSGQIDRRAMQAYKRAAWWRNSHFSDLERRVLIRATAAPDEEIWIFTGMSLLLSAVLGAGLLADTGETRPADFPETFRERRFTSTTLGKAFVQALRPTDPESNRGAHE